MSAQSSAFAILVILSLTGSASAGEIFVEWVPVDLSHVHLLTDGIVDPGDWLDGGVFCFDLQITVVDDRWTAASCDMNLIGDVEFWEHPVGGDTQPSIGMLEICGLLRFDSFYCSTEEWPNPILESSANATIFAPGSPQIQTATRRKAEWYTDPSEPNAGAGTYTIARYTVHHGWNPFEVWGSGTVYLASTGGLPWEFTIAPFPEPGALALMALGGVALIRRR